MGLHQERRHDRRARRSPPIAGILLIVGAGGGFKQTLIDTGVGTMIAELGPGSWRSRRCCSAGWSRCSSAWRPARRRVATVTAAGIVAPLRRHARAPATTSLLVLAIGAGSLFFSHVNDAGFWLVKEYFGMDRRADPQDLVGRWRR